MTARTIVIGDIHGCYEELLALLDKVQAGASDRIVAVGDLIVKGERNREVLELFMSDARFSSVLGNHDRAILRYWRGKKKKLNEQQHACRLELESGRERYEAYLASLPLTLDLGAHLVVHAGLRPGIALEEQSPKDLTELRGLEGKRSSPKGTPWYEVYDGAQTVLFGHWPAPTVRRGKCAIGIDTGCVYGYELTAYIVETGEFVQVKATRPYDDPGKRLRKAKKRLAKEGMRDEE
ncbi:MAG TPA: metallophosphoesterase [Pyrinomonadaceae bacterium]|jgi:predicted phosphodiesterase|nr:metallophosphoesterase [Pyrinomonadaceae bacterium]